MKVNSRKRQISYIHNGTDYGIAYDNITEGEYVMGVNMTTPGDIIQLVKYQNISE